MFLGFYRQCRACLLTPRRHVCPTTGDRGRGRATLGVLGIFWPKNISDWRVGRVSNRGTEGLPKNHWNTVVVFLQYLVRHFSWVWTFVFFISKSQGLGEVLLQQSYWALVALALGRVLTKEPNRVEYYLSDELVLIGCRHRTDSMQREKNSFLGRGRNAVNKEQSSQEPPNTR